MRQLITRIDDDLHARLKELSRAEGRSVNSLVIDALERVTTTPLDPRAAVRRRARDAGTLVVPPRPDQERSRDEVVHATRGSGGAVGAALVAERDAS